MNRNDPPRRRHAILGFVIEYLLPVVAGITLILAALGRIHP